PSAATKEALENCYKQVLDVLDATYKQTGYSSKRLMDGFLLHIHSDKTRGSNEWNRYQQPGVNESYTWTGGDDDLPLHCWWMSSIGRTKSSSSSTRTGTSIRAFLGMLRCWRLSNERRRLPSVKRPSTRRHEHSKKRFPDGRPLHRPKIQSLLILVGSHVNEDGTGHNLVHRGLFNLPSSLKFDEEDLLGVAKTIAFTTTADQLEGVDSKSAPPPPPLAPPLPPPSPPCYLLGPENGVQIKPDLDKRAARQHGVANTKSVHQIRELMAAAAVEDIGRLLPQTPPCNGFAWTRLDKVLSGNRMILGYPSSPSAGAISAHKGSSRLSQARDTWWTGSAYEDALQRHTYSAACARRRRFPNRAAVASKRTAKSAKGKGKGKMEEVESEDEEEAEEEGAVQEGSRAAPQKGGGPPKISKGKTAAAVPPRGALKHPKSPICEASNGEASRHPGCGSVSSCGKKRQSPADHHKKPAKRVRLAPPEASRDAPVKSVEPNPVEFDWESSARAPPTVIPCPRNANPPNRGSATTAGAPCARMQSHVEVPPAAVDPRRLGMSGAAIQPAKDQCKRCLQAPSNAVAGPSNAVAGPSGQKHQPSRAPSTERQRQHSPVPSPPSTVAPPAPPPAAAADPMAVLQALANFSPEQIMATFAVLRDTTAPAGN
ncbi:hypothetical protein B0H17DRAFT_1154987, partial [Mycena rosella]